MSEGMASRILFDDLVAFAQCIEGLELHEAFALGTLRDDLPDVVQIITKNRLGALYGSIPPGRIARTGDHIRYRPGQPALALIDVDTKGMPPSVKTTVDAKGGILPSLASVLPELELVGRVVRRSTSSGILRADTEERLPGSNGLHVFVLVRDGADIERFLRDSACALLAGRFRLAGGWSRRAVA